NVYLHYVYDLWTHRWRRKATGDVIVIRYADDTIVGFQHEHEAKAFLHDLQERMREFELALHPTKTRLIPSVATRPSNVRTWERGSPKLSTSSASRTSARDHANGARSSSGAGRSRSGC